MKDKKGNQNLFNIRSKMKIMLIDDDFEQVYKLGEFLSLQGFYIKSFNNPRIAIDAYNKELFDLVVTDYSMPQMNAVELIRELRLIDSQVIIIVLSGCPNEYLPMELLKKGAEEFFPKPLDLMKLLNTIKQIDKKTSRQKKLIKQ